jgi:hypothetical protein
MGRFKKFKKMPPVEPEAKFVRCTIAGGIADTAASRGRWLFCN